MRALRPILAPLLSGMKQPMTRGGVAPFTGYNRRLYDSGTAANYCAIKGVTGLASGAAVFGGVETTGGTLNELLVGKLTQAGTLSGGGRFTAATRGMQSTGLGERGDNTISLAGFRLAAASSGAYTGLGGLLAADLTMSSLYEHTGFSGNAYLNDAVFDGTNFWACGRGGSAASLSSVCQISANGQVGASKWFQHIGLVGEYRGICADGAGGTVSAGHDDAGTSVGYALRLNSSGARVWASQIVQAATLVRPIGCGVVGTELWVVGDYGSVFDALLVRLNLSDGTKIAAYKIAASAGNARLARVAAFSDGTAAAVGWNNSGSSRQGMLIGFTGAGAFSWGRLTGAAAEDRIEALRVLSGDNAFGVGFAVNGSAETGALAILCSKAGLNPAASTWTSHTPTITDITASITVTTLTPTITAMSPTNTSISPTRTAVTFGTNAL